MTVGRKDGSKLIEEGEKEFMAEDDALVDELLATNPNFQALVTRSKNAARKPFLGCDKPASEFNTPQDR